MSLRALQKEMNKARADGMVKIGIPHIESSVREWCWAKPVSRTHARLDNVCMAGGVQYGDIVQFEELSDHDGGPHDVMKSFVRVVTRGSTQCAFLYATEQESKAKSPRIAAVLTARWKRIHEALMALPECERPLTIEGLALGFGIAAFSVDVSPERAEEILAACPSVVEQFS
jgi:hypothetical protein